MRLPTPNPAVLYRPVDGGAVLLSMNDEVYYGLNAVGSYIWEHLPPNLHTFDELVAALRAQYPDVPARMIQADIRELLDDLLANGLVTAATGSKTETNEAHASHEARQPASQGLG